MPRQIRHGQTTCRAGIYTDRASHAGLQDELGFEPFRSFDHQTSGTFGIEQGGLRAYSAASATVDAQSAVNRMEFLFFARNGAGWTNPGAGTATIAFFRDRVRHI